MASNFLKQCDPKQHLITSSVPVWDSDQLNCPPNHLYKVIISVSTSTPFFFLLGFSFSFVFVFNLVLVFVLVFVFIFSPLARASKPLGRSLLNSLRSLLAPSKPLARTLFRREIALLCTRLLSFNSVPY